MSVESGNDLRFFCRPLTIESILLLLLFNLRLLLNIIKGKSLEASFVLLECHVV